MPLREAGEPLDHFISRFVGSRREEKQFPKIKQRLAVGYSEAREHMKKRAKGGKVKGKGGDYIVGEEGEEHLHLEPGSKGYVTPNPRTKARMEHRWMGGGIAGAPLGGPVLGLPPGGPTGMIPGNTMIPGYTPSTGGPQGPGRMGMVGMRPGVQMRAKGGKVSGDCSYAEAREHMMKHRAMGGQVGGEGNSEADDLRDEQWGDVEVARALHKNAYLNGDFKKAKKYEGNLKQVHGLYTSNWGQHPSELKPKAKGGRVGGGERFHKLEGELSHEKGITDPAALAASIGRKKYGASKMAKMSAKGRKRH